MDANELTQLITKPEWSDVELKTAATQYPKEALASVCAFANTGGGYLIFGIDERQQDPITGVRDVDTVQNAFIGILKDTKKFNCINRFSAELVELNSKHILVFYIEEALRHEKPIYLNGDMKQSYLRKGGRDDKATDEEIKRMVRDASWQSDNERLLDLDPETCFDNNTLKWYRKVYESRNNQKHYELSNLEFLDQFALVNVEDNDLKPTIGAVLMFGTEKHLRLLLPRFTLDAYWHNNELNEDTNAVRWDDRRSFECNLFATWRQLSERFMYYAEHPFDIDEANLRRSHETPDYIGFRETAVNILIHQDYSDTSRSATVNFFKDASVYFNPGDSLVDESRLGKGDSATRNPLIMQTFHRIGLSDRAGSGLKDIYKNWQQLDRARPVIINDKARKTFQITLGKKQQRSTLQQQLQQRIGIKLTHRQVQVFIACITQAQTVQQLAESLNFQSADIYPIVDYLSRQALIQTTTEGYRAPDHFSNTLIDLVEGSSQPEITVTKLSDQPQEKVTNLTFKSDQAGERFETLSKKQQTIIQLLNQPLTLKELMAKAGQSHRTHFKNSQLQPLIDINLVALTYPDNPHHQDQAYQLTELGKQVLELSQ
jgi:ATP-dependent DNA helicase RecG